MEVSIFLALRPVAGGFPSRFHPPRLLYYYLDFNSTFPCSWISCRVLTRWYKYRYTYSPPFIFLYSYNCITRFFFCCHGSCLTSSSTTHIHTSFFFSLVSFLLLFFTGALGRYAICSCQKKTYGIYATASSQKQRSHYQRIFGLPVSSGENY